MIEIIKKAITTLRRTGVSGQCSFMGSTTNYESTHPYGLYSIPKVGSMVILQSVLGDESVKVGWEYDNKKVATISSLLGEGDNAVFNPESNSYVIFRASGDIEIVASGSANLSIAATTTHTGNMTITGNLTVTGTLIAGGKDINAHVHSAGTYLDSNALPVTGASGTMV